ncbi:MAG: hypothetical protein WC876_03385 [Candidatus Thermoplasmatota archaeon]|jgi:hypothetical protein
MLVGAVVAGFTFVDLLVLTPGRPLVNQSFAGNQAEQNADKWLAKHVLEARGVWDWTVTVDLALDSGKVAAFDHRVSYGRTNGTLRQAAVQALTHRGLNRRLHPRQQAEARILAEELSGKTYVDLYPPARNWMTVAGARA